jgi:PPP family 3-phenylpropionic acid transporter
MGLMLHQVPGHVMARAQGYLTACGGIVAGLASIASGTIYETWGQGIYYVMAAMAALGGLVVWLARERLSHQPHKAASGG